jgi:hypothetical protein
LIKDTENVGVFEIQGGILDGVGRIKQHFSLSIEFDWVSWFINSICLGNCRLVFYFFSDDSHVLLVHVFDMINIKVGTYRQGVS